MSTIVWELPASDTVPTGGDSAGPGAIVSGADGEIDHGRSAVNRLVLQFQKPKIKALVRALCVQMQPLERMWLDMYVQRNINYATGEILKMFARIVGQPTRDYDDETLRRYIRARISANRSRGLGKDLIKIARLVVDDTDARYQLDNHGVAAATMIVRDIVLDFELALVLIEFLRRAVGAGIRIVLEWSAFAPEEMLAFEEFPGTVEPGLGLGSSLDADVGGYLSSAAI